MKNSESPTLFNRVRHRIRLIAMLGLTLGGSMYGRAQSSQVSQDKNPINKEISDERKTEDQAPKAYVASRVALFTTKAGLDKETLTDPQQFDQFFIVYAQNGVAIISRDQNGPSLGGVIGEKGLQCYISKGGSGEINPAKGDDAVKLVEMAWNSPDNPYNNPQNKNESTIQYQFSEDGYSAVSYVTNDDVSSLLPAITRDKSSNQFICGPLRGSSNTILLAQAQAELVKIKVEERICNDLLTKDNLTKEEQRFINTHEQKLAKWGLTRNEKGELQKNTPSQRQGDGKMHIYHSTTNFR